MILHLYKLTNNYQRHSLILITQTILTIIYHHKPNINLIISCTDIAENSETTSYKQYLSRYDFYITYTFSLGSG